MASEISVTTSNLPTANSTTGATTRRQAATPTTTASNAQAEQAQQIKDVQQASKERVEKLVEAIESITSQLSRNLQFSIDEPSGQTVVTVTERDSGKLIRKIPTEEFLALSQHIEQMNNLLFKAEA